MNKRFFQLLFLALVLFFSRPASANELGELLEKAQQSNPALQAARARVEQALLKHSELLEFFDPALFAAAGRATDYRALPFQTHYSTVSSNSFEVQGGIEVPVQPGAYFTIGGAQRLLFEPEGYDRIYQKLFGVRVRVPLLRDRGFALFGYRRSAAMTEYNQRVSELITLQQTLQRDVENAYISAYANFAKYAISQDAGKRFQSLVTIAKELARLKTIPEYQVYSTERELQIGMEDVELAKNAYDHSLLELETLIGAGVSVRLAGTSEAVVQQGEMLAKLEEIPYEKVLESRGEILTLQNRISLIETEYARTEEEMKDELYVHAGATVQTENTDGALEAHRILSDDYLEGEITLVWTRPLDYHGAKKRLLRFRSQVSELKSDLLTAELTIRQQLRQAQLSFASALRRMELIASGMKAANEMLESELERFRLGEGSSTDVLDAQKNLTVMLQRRVTAAADLLRANCEYRYATGFAQTQAEESLNEGN